MPVRIEAARFSAVAAAFAGIVALGSSGAYSWTALGAGLVGTIVLFAGVVRGANRAITIGACMLFLAAIAAGAEGAPALPVLLSVVSTVLAWDFGSYAVGVHRQLGRDAATLRMELLHDTAGVVVGGLTVTVGYGLFLTGTGNQPVSALVLLLTAAVFLLLALR